MPKIRMSLSFPTDIFPGFYSVLARSGYFSVEELATFRKINSRVQGHPHTHEGLPG
jgi:transketolase